MVCWSADYSSCVAPYDYRDYVTIDDHFKTNLAVLDCRLMTSKLHTFASSRQDSKLTLILMFDIFSAYFVRQSKSFVYINSHRKCKIKLLFLIEAGLSVALLPLPYKNLSAVADEHLEHLNHSFNLLDKLIIGITELSPEVE